MKEYKVLKTLDLDHAEQVMNNMAQVGWRVVGTTDWHPMFNNFFIITLEREVPES